MNAKQEPIKLLTALLTLGSRNAMFFGWLIRSLMAFNAGARVLEGDERFKA